MKAEWKQIDPAMLPSGLRFDVLAEDAGQIDYAKLAAKLNPHDDRNNVNWPERQMAF